MAYGGDSYAHAPLRKTLIIVLNHYACNKYTKNNLLYSDMFEKIQLINFLKSFFRNCSVSVVHVKNQAVNNFLGVAVITKANEFQTKITLKVAPECIKVAYS